MTPRVQGEPIVPGSDFVGLLASEEAKDLLFHNVTYGIGPMPPVAI